MLGLSPGGAAEIIHASKEARRGPPCSYDVDGNDEDDEDEDDKDGVEEVPKELDPDIHAVRALPAALKLREVIYG